MRPPTFRLRTLLILVIALAIDFAAAGGWYGQANQIIGLTILFIAVLLGPLAFFQLRVPSPVGEILMVVWGLCYAIGIVVIGSMSAVR